MFNHVHNFVLTEAVSVFKGDPALIALFFFTNVQELNHGRPPTAEGAREQRCFSTDRRRLLVGLSTHTGKDQVCELLQPATGGQQKVAA